MAASPHQADRGEPSRDKWPPMDDQGPNSLGPPGESAPGGPSDERERMPQESGASERSGMTVYREKQIKVLRLFLVFLP